MIIIVDLSVAKVVLQELEAIVPTNPSIPVRLIAQSSEVINSMIQDYGLRSNVCSNIYRYDDILQLKRDIKMHLIDVAMEKHSDLNDANQRWKNEF